MKKENIRLFGKIAFWVLWLAGYYFREIADRGARRSYGRKEWIIYLVVTVVLFVGMLYIDYRRKQAAFNWPTVVATVQWCNDDPPGDDFHYCLHYSYPFSGEYYAASIRVPKRRWPEDPTSMLKEVPIQVRVNPANPDESVVEAASIPGLKENARTGLIACEL